MLLSSTLTFGEVMMAAIIFYHFIGVVLRDEYRRSLTNKLPFSSNLLTT